VQMAVKLRPSVNSRLNNQNFAGVCDNREKSASRDETERVVFSFSFYFLFAIRCDSYDIFMTART